MVIYHLDAESTSILAFFPEAHPHPHRRLSTASSLSTLCLIWETDGVLQIYKDRKTSEAAPTGVSESSKVLAEAENSQGKTCHQWDVSEKHSWKYIGFKPGPYIYV
jgi:hypothetical protein